MVAAVTARAGYVTRALGSEIQDLAPDLPFPHLIEAKELSVGAGGSWLLMTHGVTFQQGPPRVPEDEPLPPRNYTT